MTDILSPQSDTDIDNHNDINSTAHIPASSSSSYSLNPAAELELFADGSVQWTDLTLAAKTNYKLLHSQRDVYYRLAKELGYRARSAFKLIEIFNQCNILQQFDMPTMRVVDLCAAPGSWSQVLSEKLYSNNNTNNNNKKNKKNKNNNNNNIASSSSKLPANRIIAVDLQEMAPLPGVFTMQGDITQLQTAQKIIDYFQGHKVSLVVSDGAPDVTGIHEIDEFVQSQLLFSAINLAIYLLENDGIFIAKIFKSSAYQLLYTQLKIFFHSVEAIKPASSRARSAENFIVCKGFKQPRDYNNKQIFNMTEIVGNTNERSSEGGEEVNAITKVIAGYLACGDLQAHMLLDNKPNNDSSCSSSNNAAPLDSFTAFL
jgi:tRNA (cytidine32/guanosine34-2'-O)-methyltransferase